MSGLQPLVPDERVRRPVPVRGPTLPARRDTRSKVRVSVPGDACERQADRVAGQVGLGAGIGGQGSGTAPAGLELPVSPQSAALIRAPGIGSALDPGIRARLGSAFGASVAEVQVHAGPASAAAASELGARAFTVGSHIHLGRGESPRDLPLLAHEAAHAARHAAAPGAPVTVQRGVGSALSRGWDMYTRMTDVGAPFARELMRWRVLGLGSDFIKYDSDSDWNDFMVGRPEIQRALAPELASRVPGWAAAGGTGSAWLSGYRYFSFNVTGVKLDELESTRLTLHGCHRIEVTGRYWVGQEDGVTKVRVYPTLVWIDRADLHAGTGTELAGGQVVDDREFSAAGWDYDIWIQFRPRVSEWDVTGGTARHVRGWPPSTGAPAAGFRG